MRDLTLGSLFDGSGGFPLGGMLAGIKPLWSSEIEPFPIRVAEKRLPDVRHYGDISKLNGAELPPVDIITFGSPCQDLSIAGKRSGLSGARSSLFFEAVRVIKEMRGVTNGKYPRYIVWENVLGALSSNKGEDFRCVLEEICKITDESADVPRPPKWQNSGTIVGDSSSLVWRVLDARFWGVPQRRKRIFLVADLNARGAGKILFESEGVSAYSAGGFRAWQRTASAAENRSRAAGGAALVFENHAQDARITGPLDIAPTVSASYGAGGATGCCVADYPSAKQDVLRPEVSVDNQPLVLSCYDVRFTSEGTKNVRANVYKTNAARTLDCSENSPDRNQGGLAVVSYGIGRAAFNQGKNALYSVTVERETEPTIVAKGPGAVAVPNIGSFDVDYIVRRLAPTECALLQGFPDWWCVGLETDEPSNKEIERWRCIFEEHRAAVGKVSKPKTDRQIIKWLKKPHSDSAEYKLWGNGVALPCVFFVLAGIAWYDSDNKLWECLYTSDIDNSPALS